MFIVYDLYTTYNHFRLVFSSLLWIFLYDVTKTVKNKNYVHVWKIEISLT